MELYQFNSPSRSIFSVNSLRVPAGQMRSCDDYHVTIT